MTTHEYIRQKFGSFGIQLSEADLLDIYPKVEDYEGQKEIQVAIVRFIPSLLMRPNVSENGFSVSWDRNALKEYYNLRCKELGINNVLTPKVRFL